MESSNQYRKPNDKLMDKWMVIMVLGIALIMSTGQYLENREENRKEFLRQEIIQEMKQDSTKNEEGI